MKSTIVKSSVLKKKNNNHTLSAYLAKGKVEFVLLLNMCIQPVCIRQANFMHLLNIFSESLGDIPWGLCSAEQAAQISIWDSENLRCEPYMIHSCARFTWGYLKESEGQGALRTHGGLQIQV